LLYCQAVDLPSRQAAADAAGRAPAALIAVLYGTLLAAALVWGMARGQPNIYLAPGSRPLALRLMSPLFGIALGLVVVLLSRLALHRHRFARVLHAEFREILAPLSRGEFLLLVSLSGVAEEALFRGAMLPQLGLLPQAAIFALLHVGPGKRFLPWTGLALAMGLVLGALFLACGDLGAPIAAHLTINLLNGQHMRRWDIPLD
jgi:membrane protease YdiL (CAAX protease family)